MSREKKAEIKAFHDDLHDIMDGAGTMKDTEIAEAFVAKGWRKRSEAEWEIVKGSNGKEKMVCTNCRHQQDLASTFTYCPNCGAKMKGGE